MKPKSKKRDFTSKMFRHQIKKISSAISSHNEVNFKNYIKETNERYERDMIDLDMFLQNAQHTTEKISEKQKEIQQNIQKVDGFAEQLETDFDNLIEQCEKFNNLIKNFLQ